MLKRMLQGVIESHKMQKTVIVKVSAVKVHPKYHKRYSVSKRYPAHVEDGIYNVGDKVVIEETKPISKTKNWRVISKV